MASPFSYLSIFLYSCDTQKTDIPSNSSPEVIITSHLDGEEILDAYVITLIGSTSDIDHSSDELMATWTSGSDMLCAAAPVSPDGTTSCETVLTVDDEMITVTVTDPENAQGTSTLSLNILPSQAPTCAITSPQESGVYYSDYSVSFLGLLTDEEDSAEQVLGFWESSQDETLTDLTSIPTSEGILQGDTLLSEGTHIISLHGEDTTGKTCTSTVTIEVGPPNSAPTCEILTPTAGSAGIEGDSVEFMAHASDVDVDADWLSAVWTSDIDGALGTSTPTVDGAFAFPFADLNIGTHLITMTVTDEVGATCTQSIEYTVGTPPSISIDAPVDNDIISEGENIVFSAIVSDEQDVPTDIFVDWSLNGVSISTQGSSPAGIAEFSDANLAFGTYQLIVTATDTDGLTDSDQHAFTVNGLPSEPDISIAPSPAYTASDVHITINADAIDPEGSLVNYSYEWSKNGAVQPIYTTDTLPSSATTKDEEWRARVTPDDGIASGTSTSVSIIISNSEPTYTSAATITTTGMLVGDSWTCFAEGSDADDGVLAPTYTWKNASGSVLQSSDTITLSAENSNPEEELTCTATLTDSDGATLESEASAIVHNTPPELTISLSPIPLTTQDDITCLAVATDADEQAVDVTYAWNIDGVSTSHQTNIISAPFSIGSTITCQATPNDGLISGNMMDAEGIIQNTPPEITDVVLDHTAPKTNDIIQATPTATDIDGHTLTFLYEWFVNGVMVYDGGDTLDGSVFFDKEDDIYVQITAHDGLEHSTPYPSTTITSANSAPEIQVSVDRSAVEVGSDILCRVDSYTDADGDTLSYSFYWLDAAAVVAQQTLASNTSTDTISNISSSGIWTCQVVPNDGTEDGSMATSTVTVYDSCSFEQTDWASISADLEDIEELLPTIPSDRLSATWAEPVHDLILHSISPEDRNGVLNDSTSCDTPPFWDQERVILGPFVDGDNPHCRIQLRDSNPSDQGLFAFNRHRWSKNEPITGEPSWLQFRFPVPEEHVATRLRYEINWARLFGSAPTQCHPDDQDASGNCILAALDPAESWDDSIPAGLFILWGEAGSCEGWTISGPHEPINNIEYSNTKNYTIDVPEEIQDVEEMVVTFMVYHQYPGGCENNNCISGEDYPYNIAFHGVDLFTEKVFSPPFEPPTVHPRLFGDNETWMSEMEQFENMDCLDSSWPVNSSWGGLTNVHNNWDLITKGGMSCENDVPTSLYDVGFAEPYLNGTASWNVTQAVKALHLVRRERACQSTGIGTCWFDPQEVDDLAAAIIDVEMTRLPTIVWNSFSFEFDLRTREPMRVYTLLADVLWDDLTTQQHQDLLDTLGVQIDGYLNHFDDTHWAVFNGNNWTPVLAEGALYWAITYYHEDDRAPKVARLALYSLWLHRHSYLDDGVYNEGLLMYSQVSFDPLVQVSRLAKYNFGMDIQSPPWDRMEDFSNWALAFMGTDGYTIDFGDSWAKKGWNSFMPLLAHMVDPSTGRFDKAPDPCFAYQFFNNKYYFYGVSDPWSVSTSLAQDWPSILAACPAGNQPLAGMEVDTWEVGGWGSIRIGLPGSTTIGSQVTTGPSLYAQHDQIMLATSAIPNSNSHTELDFGTMVWIAYGNRLLIDYGYGSIGNDRYESYPDYDTFDNNPTGHNTLVIPEAYNGSDLSTNTSQIDGEVGSMSQITIDGHTLITLDGSAVYGRDHVDLGWMEHFERLYLPFEDGTIFVIDSLQARSDRGLISPEEYWLTYPESASTSTCSTSFSGMQKVYGTDSVTLLPACSVISKYDLAESAGRILGTSIEGGSFVEMPDLTLINRLNQVDSKSQFKWTPDEPQDSDIRVFALLSATSQSTLPAGEWQWSTCGNYDCVTLSLDSVDYATLHFDNQNGQYSLVSIDEW